MSQYVFTKVWDKTLGGIKQELGTEIQSSTVAPNGELKCFQINDGRILICGTSCSPVGFDVSQLFWSTCDVWMIAIEGSNGQKAWDRHYGGFNTDFFEDLTAYKNNYHFLAIRPYGGNVIGGDYTVPYTNSSPSVAQFRYLLLDSTWDVVWDRMWSSYGGVESKKILVNNSSYSLFLEDGDVTNSDLIDTTCCSSNAPSKTVIAAYDSSGNYLWDKAYGAYKGNGAVSIDLIPNDSGFLLMENQANSTYTGCDFTNLSHGGPWDVNIYSLDSIGHVIWQRCYGGVGSDYAARSLLKTVDGNFVFVASSTSPQGGDLSQSNPSTFGSIWIVKINPSGGIIWNKRYGSCGGLMYVRPLINTLDNGFLIGATIGYNDTTAGCDVTENGFGKEDYWIVKLDSAGNKEWDKRWGGSGSDYLSDLIQLPGGDYITAGFSFSDSTGSKTEHNRDASLATSDFWLVRFKATKVVGLEEFIKVNGQLSLVPNPARDNCSIACEVENALLTLYDITGRIISKQIFNQKIELEVNNLSTGIYIVEIKDKQGRSVKGKLIKE